MGRLINKWKSLPDSVKASVAFVFSSLVLKGISFFTTPIFTRIMATSEYGIMATYSSWLSILEVFALLGLTSAGVFNVGMNDYKNSRDQYMSAVLVLVNCSTIIVFSLIFLVKALTNAVLKLPYNLLILMLIHFIFSPALLFWVTRQRYEFKYRLATIITIFSSIIGQIAAFFVVTNIDQDQGTWKLWSNEVGTLLFAIPIYFLVLIRGKKYIDKDIWKNVLAFAIPLLPHYLAQHVMSGADRIMLGEMISKADAGIYNVVATISMIAVLFWNAINASLVPYTFNKLNIKEYTTISKTVESLLFAYGGICLAVTLVAPEVLRFLAPEQYYGGVYAVPPIAMVSFLTALYSVYANIEFYHKKAKNIAIATIVAAIINVGLNALLIPKYSYIGAAYTTLISNIVLIGFHYWGYRKSVDERVYNDKTILLFSILLLAMCLSCNLLYINNIVRYCTLACLAMILFFCRNKLSALIKQVIRK